MSSVIEIKVLARDLGDILAPGAGWKAQVSAIHRAMTSRQFELSIEDLNWSRVKAWFYGEARRVDYEELVSLRELKAIEEARREQRHYENYTNRLAAALAAEGKALDRKQMEILRRMAFGSGDLQGAAATGSRREVRGVALSGNSVGS